VLQAHNRQFGLIVDGINDTEEIVVKPLAKQLKGIPLFAGAMIMGDGRVALILDVLGIAQRAGVISEVRDRVLADKLPILQDRWDKRQTLLLFDVGKDRRLAIPLSMVARLENVPRAAVEKANNREVVQYRGQIMPLLRLAGVLGVPPRDEQEDQIQVVVYGERGRSFGLVVDQIHDIGDFEIELQYAAHDCTVLGTTVIQQRVTDILDVPKIIHSADPTFFTRTTA